MTVVATITRLLRCAVILGLAAVAHPAAAAGSDPAQVVEKFHSDLLQVMKNAKSLGYQGRFRVLTPAIGEAFHLPAMTRLVAGQSNWKSYTPAQKEAFINAFADMTTATYANRFKGYSGETFHTLESVPVRPKTILVKANVTKSNGEVVNLNYLVREFSSGWRVIDVYLKGSISELATKRSEYSGILRRQGLDALLGRIRNRVATLEADAKAN